MTRQNIIIFTLCMFVSLITLGALYTTSPMGNDVTRNSFTRKILPRITARAVAKIDLKYNSFYVAGGDNENIYLGNYTAPFLATQVNTSTHKIEQSNIKIHDLDSISDPKRFTLSVEPPNFFLSHGVEPIIVRGLVGNWTASKFMPDSGYYFTESIPISSSSLVLKYYSRSNEGYELAKKTTNAPFFEYKNDLLQKQIDGVFCLDGRLHYSKKANKIVYLHFYRNEVIITDTSLNLLHRTHTIDTFSHAQVKVAKIKSKNQTMLSAPPPQVNAASCVSDKNLIVQSNLLSKEEGLEEFIISSVLDVYDLENGQYKHSFYVPNHNNTRISSMYVQNKKLIAVQGKTLVIYDISNANE